ncbi:MAG TPA: hypothetical protein VKU00_02670 [Chthonomonadaceae bacterium]|nr:hypothetical protein [Chthonomonadaceae bacterium]
MRIKPIFSLIFLCALFGYAPTPRPAIAELKDAPPDSRNADIDYILTPDLKKPSPHLQVQMNFKNRDNKESITVQLPVWSPGDYNLQNHAQYVQNFHAYRYEGSSIWKEIKFTHPNANTWEMNTQGVDTIRLTYDIPETPPGNFSENVHFTQTQAFVNGPAALLYVVGYKEVPIRLFLDSDLDVRVPLNAMRSSDPPYSFAAPDYDTLADSPMLISLPDAVAIRTFNSGGTTFRTVFYGDVKSIQDPDAYTPVIQKLIQAETAVMGPMPTTHYDFFFDVNGRGGGLEHLNACRIALPSFASPQRVAPFVAHEFFHLWNVKRIRPEVLGPFDYIHPPKTRNLWFAEGVTEYYAQLSTRRAGFYSDEDLLSHFRNAIRGYNFNAASKRVTADEASKRVWETQTSEGYGGLSYYAKGELIGLCFDLKIRQVTQNRKSLDDMMRLLMQRHAPPKPGYKEDELRDTLSEVAGQDLSKFYDQLARSTDDMPFAECLGYAGLDVNCRPLPDATDAQRALLKQWLSGK